MDTYYDYKPIRMRPLDAPKIAFMTSQSDYYYEVVSFGLKNARVIYQMLMDTVLYSLIRRKIEVYIDDMVVKTPRERITSRTWKKCQRQ